LFAWHKLPLRSYLLAVAIFCNEVKGKSMLALARELDVHYETAFVLAHKLREAMAFSVKGLRIGGKHREAEIDLAYFGGHVRPENLAADRVDRRLAENRSGKQQVVVVMRQRGGRTLAQVSPAEEAALAPFAFASSKAPPSMPTKVPPGTSCTPASPCSGSTINRATASTVPAPTERRPISLVRAAAKPVITITSPGLICPATHGGAPAPEALKLQRALPDDALVIVARGEKKDEGGMTL
jgi:hypothetical protein